VTVGSFGLARITADLNTSLNLEKIVLARIDTAIHRSNSFSDLTRTKSFAFALGLLYIATDRLTFLIDG